jgi:hypothetical protein
LQFFLTQAYFFFLLFNSAGSNNINMWECWASHESVFNPATSVEVFSKSQGIATLISSSFLSKICDELASLVLFYSVVEQ